MAYATVADGVELYYEVLEPPSHPVSNPDTVVFLNGLTMDTTAWAAVREYFSADYRTLVYDARGQGRSSTPVGPYTPEQHASDLLALLAHLGNDSLSDDSHEDGHDLGALHLVGLSNGGLVAMLVAAQLTDEPERVQSVSVIDSFLGVDPMLRTILDSWKSALAAGGSALRFDVATPWVWGHSFLNRHYQDVLSFRERAAERDPDVIRYLIDGLLGFSGAHKALRAYNGPLLAAVGQEDILTPLRYSHDIVEWARHGVLVKIDQAGHAAPIERPDAVARVVRGFIGRRQEFMTPLFPGGRTRRRHDPHERRWRLRRPR
ncbi:MAG: alpha/beta hydrolase [Trueperaceae bacterium]|nr:alpha/beta hydrolase [Trueperaceae bacterium]